MKTRIRRLRLDDQTWAALEQLSSIFVPEENRKRHAPKNSSKVAPMFRMIAVGDIHLQPKEQATNGNI